MIEVISYLNPVTVILYLLVLSGLFLAGSRTDRIGAVTKLMFKLSFGLGYCFVLAIITLLSREAGSRDGLDLLPFATLGRGAASDAYVVENVLLFIPFGFLLAYIFPGIKSGLKAAVIGLAVSLLIETTQYLTGCGYAQTDDLLTNMLGAWIGYLVYRGLKRLGDRLYMKSS